MDVIRCASILERSLPVFIIRCAFIPERSLPVFINRTVGISNRNPNAMFGRRVKEIRNDSRDIKEGME